MKRSEHTPDTEDETVQELPAPRDQAERAESVGGESSSASAETESTLANSSDSSQRNSEISDDDKDKRLSADVDSASSTNNGEFD